MPVLTKDATMTMNIKITRFCKMVLIIHAYYYYVCVHIIHVHVECLPFSVYIIMLKLCTATKNISNAFVMLISCMPYIYFSIQYNEKVFA